MLALLALETGHLFYGQAIGIAGIRTGEVVFNTALTGYQEILTDPSYTQQIITFTYPHIGNTGINLDDHQANRIYASGLIIKSLSPTYSNWRATMSLQEFLIEQQVVGIAEVDTRGLTKLLRENGSLRGCIMSGIIDAKYALQQAKNYTGLQNLDLTSAVSTTETYTLQSRVQNCSYNIVVMDFGVKSNILDCLRKLGCNLQVVPAHTSADTILSLQPDGILLSNGPGDPAACVEIIQTIKVLLSNKIPVFGICLGHQLLALALGARTYKMSFGHHGSNHPVLDLRNKKIMITSQNHGFAVDADSLHTDLEITHCSLFDRSLQGFRHKELPFFGFQGHPEAAPGPHDALNLFDDFLQAVRKSNAQTPEFA